MFWENIQSSRLCGAWCWHWGRAQFCSVGHSEEGWPQDSSHPTAWQAFGMICCGDWASHSETVRQVSENCILGFSRQNKKLFHDKVGKPPVLLLWLIYFTCQYYVVNCQPVTSGKWYNPLSYLRRKMWCIFDELQSLKHFPHRCLKPFSLISWRTSLVHYTTFTALVSSWLKCQVHL